MKKFRIPLLILALLAIIILIVANYQSNREFRSKENNFVVEDTASVTKFFLADRVDRYIKCTRQDDGKWIINDTFQANKEVVDLLLETFATLDVKYPVSNAATENIIKSLSVNSVKTEIYQKVYRINLFNRIKLFPREKLTRTYYVGSETMDKMGSFLIMEGSKQPYVVSIPGLRGFISTRYTTNIMNWRNRNLLNMKLNDIKQISLIYPDSPTESFILVNNNNKSISLFTHPHKKQIHDFDTLKAIQYFNNFKDLNCEAVRNDFSQAMVDSLNSQKPYFSLEIVDFNNKAIELKAWKRKAAPGAINIDDGSDLEFDPDRMHATLSTTKDVYVIQYYAFGNIILPIDWFDKNWKEKLEFVDIF